MIDTICLLVPKKNLDLLPVDNKIPRWDMQSKTENYAKYVKNPSKIDKASDLYFPRLTTYSRRFGQDANVKMEFSVPKLLWQNNLTELVDKDFTQVIKTLKDRLYRMGVIATEQTLASANVSSCHFSKNIVLTDGYTANYLISEMNKIDLRKSFDFARARYINDGQSLCAHTTAHELVIYDKIADLAKGKKRAIDKDQTAYQMSLFKDIEKKNTLFEVLRFEIRLAKKQKLNSVLNKLGYARDPTFKDVFNTKLSQQIVTHYWQTLIKARNLGLFTVNMSNKDMLRAIYKTYPNISPHKALYLLGLFLVAKDGNGMRELRSLLTKKINDRTWYRLTSDLRQISMAFFGNPIRNWVSQIDQGLKDYKPLTHNDYEQSKK